MGAVFACNTVATVLATPLCGYLGNLPWLRRWAVVTLGLLQLGVGPSFAYSLPVHAFRTRRDRVASLITCRLHGAATQSASPLGPSRALTLPCGWNNAGKFDFINCIGVLHHTESPTTSLKVLASVLKDDGAPKPSHHVLRSTHRAPSILGDASRRVLSGYSEGCLGTKGYPVPCGEERASRGVERADARAIQRLACAPLTSSCPSLPAQAP